MEIRVLGKYSPINTKIHKLDPRGKILMMIMLMVSIFLNYGSWTTMFVLSGINLVVITAILLWSKVKLKDFFFQLKSLWFLLFLLLIINIFIPPKDSVHIIASNGGFKLFAESFLQTGKIFLRLLLMLMVAMSFTASTSPQEITYGFSFYFRPLKKIKFPSEEIAMTVSIALRFIPTLIEETNRIYKAQTSRGVDFKHGSLAMKFKGIISLIVPLFVASFQMSDDLAYALEARGYSPNKTRSSYHIYKWKICDTLSLIFITLYMGGFITLTAMNFDFMKILIPAVW